MIKFTPYFHACFGFFAAVGVLSLTHTMPAQAQTPGVSLAALVSQINALKTQQQTDEQTIASLQSIVSSQATTIRNLNTQEQNDISNTQNQEKNDIQKVQTQEKNDFTKITSSVVALQTLTAPLSLSNDPNVGGTNTLLTITGVNVQIVDGSGYTDDGIPAGSKQGNAKLTGLGNLIVGYNATTNNRGEENIRTGSHNLILGDQNSYSSFGGLIAGQNNRILAPYASVSGGHENGASGYAASVSGGNGNIASSDYSSVSGGQNNTASGPAASVSGGNGNTASGYFSSVSGGQGVTQSSSSGWSGGSYHTP